MPYKYAYQQAEKTIARAVARDVAISPKAAIMLANFIRGKPVTRIQRDLTNVIAKKEAVPFTRFTNGAGHKPGIGPGKYPVKAAKVFLTIVNSVAANAKDLGLSENLRIVSVTTHQAASGMRQGRKRGRQRKASHVEVIAAEYEPADKKRTPKKAAPTKEVAKKSEAEKVESAPVTPKKTVAKKAPAKKTAESKKTESQAAASDEQKTGGEQ